MNQAERADNTNSSKAAGTAPGLPAKPPVSSSLPRRQRLDSGLSNVARIYDALLGGKANYAADREAARRLIAAVPHAARAARANRSFLARAVHLLAAEEGIEQFLDIGTGLPTQGNVHQAPGSHVVISHVTGDEISEEAVSRVQEIYAAALTQGTARSRADIVRFFDGLELIKPGLVDAASWRSERCLSTIEHPVLFYAGVGRKLTEKGAAK